MRPMVPASEVTPKKFGPRDALIVKEFNKTLLGLKTAMTTLPADGPGKTSNPTALAAPKVKFSVSIKEFGPTTLLGLPATPAPSTTMLGWDVPGTALYVTPGSKAPAAKHALAVVLLSGPLQDVTPPAATNPASNVPTGRPGAAVSKADRSL
jgi:hypothetical protein